MKNCVQITDLSFSLDLEKEDNSFYNTQGKIDGLKKFYKENPKSFEDIMSDMLIREPEKFKECMQLRNCLGIYDKINMETLDIK